MKRQFSLRERVLLVILALLLLFCVYYILVDKPVRETILNATERQSAAQSELTIASAKLEKMHAMQASLDGLDQSAKADVPDYDNSRDVVQLLNQAMAMSSEYSLSFGAVSQQGAIAVRPINMDFRCDGYETGKQILNTLLESPYRCRITSMHMSCDEGDVREQKVLVRASVTFYEYLAPEQRQQN